MELTARDLERIPRENLRVPLREFGRLWLTAERRADAAATDGREWDPYLGGVLASCRWIAGMISYHDHPDGRVPERVPAPITRTREKAHEELIARETDAAERAVADREKDAASDFVTGAHATLAWAWRRSGVPPIEVTPAQAG
jgi:hypothetical protein